MHLSVIDNVRWYHGGLVTIIEHSKKCANLIRYARDNGERSQQWCIHPTTITVVNASDPPLQSDHVRHLFATAMTQLKKPSFPENEFEHFESLKFCNHFLI